MSDSDHGLSDDQHEDIATEIGEALIRRVISDGGNFGDVISVLARVYVRGLYACTRRGRELEAFDHYAPQLREHMMLIVKSTAN